LPLEFGGASALLKRARERISTLLRQRPHVKVGNVLLTIRDVLPQSMAKLTDEHRRALRLQASPPGGYTEADMLTHGFELAMLGDLIFAGFALAAPRDALPVMWIEITEAGRKAIAD
jgi:hypothetical protein